MIKKSKCRKEDDDDDNKTTSKMWKVQQDYDSKI